MDGALQYVSLLLLSLSVACFDSTQSLEDSGPRVFFDAGTTDEGRLPDAEPDGGEALPIYPARPRGTPRELMLSFLDDRPTRILDLETGATRDVVTLEEGSVGFLTRERRWTTTEDEIVLYDQDLHELRRLPSPCAHRLGRVQRLRRAPGRLVVPCLGTDPRDVEVSVLLDENLNEVLRGGRIQAISPRRYWVYGDERGQVIDEEGLVYDEYEPAYLLDAVADGTFLLRFAEGQVALIHAGRRTDLGRASDGRIDPLGVFLRDFDDDRVRYRFVRGERVTELEPCPLDYMYTLELAGLPGRLFDTCGPPEHRHLREFTPSGASRFREVEMHVSVHMESKYDHLLVSEYWEDGTRWALYSPAGELLHSGDAFASFFF